MSTNQNQFAKIKPLLYITQPTAEAISVNMQGTYTGKTDNTLKPIDKEMESVQETLPIKQKSVLDDAADDEANINNEMTVSEEIEIHYSEEISENDENVGEVVNDQDHEQNPQPVYTRKAFKNMDNDEKIHYLLNKPSYIPNIPCEIRTVKNMYTGFIVDDQDGEISIMSMTNMKLIFVDRNEIVDIRLMVR